MSERASTPSPFACSGEKYVAVPRTDSVRVSESAACARAIPKSMTFTSPVGVIITFAGLMSRCTSPARCANDKPAATPSAISAARSGSSGPSSRMMSERLRPCTYSMTMYWMSPSEPVSKTLTTLGWFSAAAAWASRRNRSTNVASLANWRERTFTATGRSSTRSVPR